jgi:hypothetical protein
MTTGVKLMVRNRTNFPVMHPALKDMIMGKSSGSTWERDLLAMARSFCDQVALGKSSRHIMIEMTGPNGVTRNVICSSTPGDYRTLANTARQMKRVASQVGSYR